jgi:hypothetical protein
VSNGETKATDDIGRQWPDAPLARHRPGYPSSGCVPAEPDSVSPGGSSLTRLRFNTIVLGLRPMPGKGSSHAMKKIAPIS